MKKKLLLLGSLAASSVALYCCNNPTTPSTPPPPVAAAAPTPAKVAPFPDSSVTGINFPTDSNTINHWLNTMDTTSIYAHGWGIWAGLTAPSGDKMGEDDMYVYETWPSPEDLANILASENNLKAESITRPRVGKLRKPHQFEHSAKFKRLAMMKMAGARPKLTTTPCNQPQWGAGVYPLAVTVNYNAPAANHILKYKLFDTSALTAIVKTGATDIPDFPDSAISLKPTYELVPPNSIKNGFFALRVWTGPNFCDSGYGSNQWPGVVYIDVNNKSNGDGSVDMNGSGRTPQNSYNLNTIIHFTVKKGDVAMLDSGNQTSGNVGDSIAFVGNIAIMVGMHVTTKEIKRWTWQSFWWTPNPTTGLYPSSPFIAGVPHSKVKGAAAHYSMAIGYTYIWPNQPYSGGNNKGTPIYSFNPFLESGFGINVFQYPATVITPTGTVSNMVGCQTNCMSCHALAIYSADSTTKTQPGFYLCDTYIDLGKGNKYFNKRLKLDFLWSIQDNLINK